uniref:Uncharacterized protein n=1 Tax=Anguilla anguilla TaxID=7936 RepID=A0A0E9VAP1_ANGAN
MVFNTLISSVSCFSAEVNLDPDQSLWDKIRDLWSEGHPALCQAWSQPPV